MSTIPVLVGGPDRIEARRNSGFIATTNSAVKAGRVCTWADRSSRGANCPAVCRRAYYLFYSYTISGNDGWPVIQGDMNMNIRTLIIACASAIIVGGLAPAIADTKLPNTNMPGRDYRDFAMNGTSDTCREACMKDGHCEAWTFVKPGIQGRQAHCWLKDRVPPSVASSCCTSGTRAQRID
jgi:hypothetical protein